MLSADSTRNSLTKFYRKQLAKTGLLLVIFLGLLWFSEEFSPEAIFEPQTTGWVLWISYAKDLIQPFAFYFFICLGERWLKSWLGRAAVAFAIPTGLEFGQALYYRISTSHYVGAFDPVDILMYTLGVGLAVIVEQKIFARMLRFW